MTQPEKIYTRFDDYEIHPVIYVDEDSLYVEQRAPNDPVEADMWSLYGHIPGVGVNCIGDFKSYEAAEEYYYRVTGERYGLHVEECSPEISKSYWRKRGALK